MTGLHKIRPVKCKQCRDTIGWKYVFAYEESEKYKEGKCIIERAYLAKNRSRSNSNNSISDKEQDDEGDQEEGSIATELAQIVGQVEEHGIQIATGSGNSSQESGARESSTEQ